MPNNQNADKSTEEENKKAPTIDINNLKGLSQDEVKDQIDKYGYNEIVEKSESWAHRLFKKFWGPIPWMIEVAAILSAVVQRWEDFTVIMAMLLFNAFVDFYQESKALSAISVLKKKLAHKALVFREWSWQSIDAKEIVPDDIIKVKIGDVVPADCDLLDGSDFLQVDQAALTGESLPVNKQVGESLYANAIIKEGEMLARVTATGLNTYFGKTVGLIAKAEKEEKSHFQTMVMKVGNFLIMVTLVLIAIIIATGIERHEHLPDLLIFALILTIAAIPVAMPAVLTITMAQGASALARKKAIVTKLSSIEEAAGMDILCSDKTGTLTQNKMTLTDPYLLKGYSKDELMLYAGLASKQENHDPIETPIFDYLFQNKLDKKLTEYTLKKFLPFDPVHKRTEGTYEGKTCMVFTKGAPQVIIEQSDEGEFDKKEAYAQVESFASKGFRTLGVAYRQCDEHLYHFVGLIPLFDPPRQDSKEAIKKANDKSIEVKMITGDNIDVAKYISGLLGIGDNIRDTRDLKGESIDGYLYLSEVISRAITQQSHPDATEEEIQKEVDGVMKRVKRQLYNMPIPKGSVKKHESQITEAIESANGFAQVFPEDKYFIVDNLQKAGHIVGMTGDGVNDAPALKKSDCGIAVSGATDAARAAADIVLMAPGLTVIIDAISQSRIVFERMHSYVVYRITETIRLLLFITLSIVMFNFYPITAIMIILLALLNDIPIMTIAYDNTKVREKPVRWNMKSIYVLSSWLGVAGVLSSFMLFYIVMIYLKAHPQSSAFFPDIPNWIDIQDSKSYLGFVQSLFFVNLTVAGHFTIYNTRISDWFFNKPYPAWKLNLALFLTALGGTFVAIYGFELMTQISWQWALFIWGYAFIWFIFNDAIKMLLIHYYRKKYGEDAI